MMIDSETTITITVNADAQMTIIRLIDTLDNLGIELCNRDYVNIFRAIADSEQTVDGVDELKLNYVTQK